MVGTTLAARDEDRHVERIDLVSTTLAAREEDRLGEHNACCKRQLGQTEYNEFFTFGHESVSDTF